MKIFCVVLNHNLPGDTISVVSDLKKQTVKPEIIVVDNCSTDNSVELIRKAHPDISLIARTVNDGVSGGYNAGIDEALKNKADYVAVLNNDLIITDKDLLRKLVAALKDDPSAGCAGPLIHFAKGFEYHDKYKDEDLGKVIWFAGGKIDWKNVYHSHRGVDEVDRGQYQKTESTDFITGAFMIFPAQTLKTIGTFSATYALYLEDAELCERIKKSGKKLIFVPAAKISHKVSQTAGNKIGGEMNDYYTTRNRLAFGLTYAPLRTKFALLREAVKIFLTGRDGQKRGVKDSVLRKSGFV